MLNKFFIRLTRVSIALVVLNSFILCHSAHAVKEFYGISRSIRSLGMGGAFYGLSDDQYALFYNPAGLSLYRGSGELMLEVNAYAPSNISQLINTFSNTGSLNSPSAILNAVSAYQGSAMSGGVGLLPFYLHKNFSVGLLLADTKINAALLGNNFDSSIDVTGISDSGLFIGYGRSFLNDSLHIGFNTKILGRVGGHKVLTALDLVSPDGLRLDLNSLGGAGIGLDFDLGAIYELPTPIVGLVNRFSLTFNNLLATSFSLSRIQGTPPQLPRLVSLGSSFVFPGWEWIDNFNVLVDLAEFQLGGQTDTDLGARSGAFFKHVNLGVEIPMNGWFVLRGGIHQGAFTAGVGLEFRALKLELATYAEELGVGVDRLTSRRYALQLTIGGGSSSPEPITALSREKTAPLDEEAPKHPTKPVQVIDKNLLEDEARKPDSEPTPAKPAAPAKTPEQSERQGEDEGAMNSKGKKNLDRFDTENLAKDAYGQ